MEGLKGKDDEEGKNESTNKEYHYQTDVNFFKETFHIFGIL